MQAFKELIQQNPDVCANCFRRNWDRYEVNFYQPIHKADDRFYPLRDSIAPIVSDKRYPTEETQSAYDEHGERVICKCGVMSAFDKERPVSKRQLLDYVNHLTDTLEELDVDFDEDVLYDHVRARKADPKYQGRDDEIIGEAVERAIIRDLTAETEG